MMQKLLFLIQGSASEPYQVEFQFENGQLTGLCSCPAGSIGKHCKHRINLLTGSTKNIVEGMEQVETLLQLLGGTKLEKALNDFIEAERIMDIEIKAAKKKRNNYEHALSRAFLG